jgi:hypothetical protein
MYSLADLCSQAKTYFVIAFLTLLYTVIKDTDSWPILLLKSAVFLAWTFFLNFLCGRGYKAVAWVAATIPHFIFVAVTVVML